MPQIEAYLMTINHDSKSVTMFIMQAAEVIQLSNLRPDAIKCGHYFESNLSKKKSKIIVRSFVIKVPKF